MTNDLTKGSTAKLISVFAFSFLITNILGLIYNTTDSIMVSNYVDKHALGAISAISPVLTLLQGFLSSTVSGFSICIGSTFGNGDHDRMRKLFANGISLTAVLVIPVLILACALSSPIVSLMNVQEPFFENAKAYFWIIILSTPIGAVSWIIGGALRALGDSKTPLWISAVSGASNVGFNYIFLCVIPRGVSGAAVGTVCSSAVGMVIYLIVFRRKMSVLFFGLGDLRIDKGSAHSLLSNGISLGLLSSIVSIGSIILQRTVNGFSPAMVTGIATGDKVLGFLWFIFMAIESALIYFSSQNLGAGRIDRVKEGVRYSLLIMLGCGTVIVALILLVGDPIYRMFLGAGNDADSLSTLEYAKSYVISQMIFYPFMVLLCSYRGATKGSGVTLPTILCGVMELLARFSVSAAVQFFELSEKIKILMIYSAGPVAWIGSSVMLMIVLPKAWKRLNLKQPNVK